MRPHFGTAQLGNLALLALLILEDNLQRARTSLLVEVLNYNSEAFFLLSPAQMLS